MADGRTVRAGILITGTEVLTGRVADRNGPWLAEQLRGLGVDVGQVVVVGDRPDDLVAALRHLFTDHQLVITSGGLGPTADDITVDAVASLIGGAPPIADPAHMALPARSKIRRSSVPSTRMVFSACDRSASASPKKRSSR